MSLHCLAAQRSLLGCPPIDRALNKKPFSTAHEFRNGLKTRGYCLDSLLYLVDLFYDCLRHGAVFCSFLSPPFFLRIRRNIRSANLRRKPSSNYPPKSTFEASLVAHIEKRGNLYTTDRNDTIMNMNSLKIPENGVMLKGSASKDAGALPPQAFAISLSDNVIEDMIACVQNGNDISLALGANPVSLSLTFPKVMGRNSVRPHLALTLTVIGEAWLLLSSQHNQRDNRK